MVYEIFCYPNFEDIVDSGINGEILQANFAHIRQLCDIELGKQVKLKDKVLNHLSNMHLRIFHYFTRDNKTEFV